MFFIFRKCIVFKLIIKDKYNIKNLDFKVKKVLIVLKKYI